MSVIALFNPRGYVCRLYSKDWDRNIDAWLDEIKENFDSILLHFGDDPKAAHVHGEPKHLWMRFTKGRRAIIKDFEFEGAEQITMIRVHRNSTPKRKKL